jgi:hypothetical protein
MAERIRHDLLITLDMLGEMYTPSETLHHPKYYHINAWISENNTNPYLFNSSTVISSFR